jgi:hypothetical protein
MPLDFKAASDFLHPEPQSADSHCWYRAVWAGVIAKFQDFKVCSAAGQERPGTDVA